MFHFNHIFAPCIFSTVGNFILILFAYFLLDNERQALNLVCGRENVQQLTKHRIFTSKKRMQSKPHKKTTTHANWGANNKAKRKMIVWKFCNLNLLREFFARKLNHNNDFTRSLRDEIEKNCESWCIRLFALKMFIFHTVSKWFPKFNYVLESEINVVLIAFRVDSTQYTNCFYNLFILLGDESHRVKKNEKQSFAVQKE